MRAAEVDPLAAPRAASGQIAVLGLFMRRARARRADNQMLAACRVDLTRTDLGEGRAQAMSDEARRSQIPLAGYREARAAGSTFTLPAEREPIMLPPGAKRRCSPTPALRRLSPACRNLELERVIAPQPLGVRSIASVVSSMADPVPVCQQPDW